ILNARGENIFDRLKAQVDADVHRLLMQGAGAEVGGFVELVDPPLHAQAAEKLPSFALLHTRKPTHDPQPDAPWRVLVWGARPIPALTRLLKDESLSLDWIAPHDGLGMVLRRWVAMNSVSRRVRFHGSGDTEENMSHAGADHD